MYYKSFLILVFLVLFGSYSNRVTAQTASDKRPPATNIKDPKKPTDSLASAMPAAKAINAEALELYREGTKLTEAGQFSQAVENLEQALRLEPEYADAYSALGRAQFKMRQWEKAAVNFRHAIELRAKQRALQDQKVLARESKDNSTLVRSAPTSTQVRQEANANVSTVKPTRPEPEKAQRPRRYSEISAPAQITPTIAQTKLPKENSGNDAGVKRPNPESLTTRQPQQQNEVSTPAKAITKSPQVTRPQQANGTLVGLKPAPPESQAARQPQKQNEVSTQAQASSKAPQIKLPQPISSNATGVKLSTPGSQTPRQPQKQNAVSTQAQPSPTATRVTLPRATGRNVARLNPLIPVSETTRQLQKQSIVITPALLGSKIPPVAQPQANSGNTAGLKPPSPESEKTRQPQKQNAVSAQAQPSQTTPRITLPHATSKNVARVNPLIPVSETTGQPQKQSEVVTLALLGSIIPPVTLTQGNSGNAGDLKPPSPEPETTRQSEGQNEVSTPAQLSSTTPQVTVPHANTGNAGGVNPPIPEPKTMSEPLERNQAIIPSQVIPNSQVMSVASNASIKLPAENGETAAGVNPSIPSETTREPKRAAESVAELETNPEAASDQKPELESVSSSTTVSPAPAALATANASPVSITTSSEESSLTRIYRIGPSDVLDVRINDSETSQSTLFTVTPSGLLEHPMLPEPLLVTGFTEDEIRAKIENELSKRALLDNPKVAIGVRDYASHTILVSGLVQDPGTKILKREAIPLFVVVADAQPLPEASRVTVRRAEPDHIYEIDLNRVADMEMLVRTGDVVTLHPSVTQFVYIGGEVKSPGEKTFRDGLTLMQAIITAGGVTTKSKVAEIGREDGQGFLVPTRFSLKDIHSGKAIDPILKPGDRITILP